MPKIKLIAIIAFLLTPFFSCAQFKLMVGGQKHAINTFKNDSIAGYERSFFGYNGLVNSIKSSDYPLEVRIYIAPFVDNLGSCIILRGTTDSLFMLRYQLQSQIFFNFNKRKGGRIVATIPPDNIRVKFFADTIGNKLIAQKFLKALIANHITDVEDSQSLYESLRKQSVMVKQTEEVDCCSNVSYEIKIGKQTRNFRSNFRYYSRNLSIPAFKQHKNLEDILENFLR